MNTCQTNPDDENYYVYMEVTDKLVKAKKDLANLKDQKEDVLCYYEDIKELESLKQQVDE